MKSRTSKLILIVLCLFGSCNPIFTSSIEKEYETISYNEEVLVIELDEKVPKNSDILGDAKIRDGGFSPRCNKEALVDIAKREARRLGGNIIKITKDKNPNFWNSCHRLNVQILRKTEY